VIVNGTLSPLLELGLGFHAELTVRENAALYGAVLGYPEAEIDQRVDEVIRFAELERFRDAKLKSLSSGMLVRLAFSTALRADADILLLDEVLAVGDVQFQRKCMDVFADLRQQNKTIVLVSHDVGAVTAYCEKVFWIDHGRLVMQGEAHEVVTTYLALSQQVIDDGASGNLDHPAHHRTGDGRVRFVAARLLDDTDTPTTVLRARTRAVLTLDVEGRSDQNEPVFGMLLRRGGEVVYSTNTNLIGAQPAPFAAGEHRQVRFAFDVALANGFYVIDIALVDRVKATIHDWVTNAVCFQVQGSTCHDGVADLAAGFESVAASTGAMAAGRES
jgi:ABC-type sugar transport system ATPase subunit